MNKRWNYKYRFSFMPFYNRSSEKAVKELLDLLGNSYTTPET